ncbi:unnamed protein product [Phytophthora fragariaefolia]|uniref:Unnamed protein product n=1 Tax=Phytophthora fragariaefolia TaxID=1490495 RepID=A0A9W7D7E5_9STRA|nr:unnamed protein product [Phytophthora fragariaefolia]
MEAVSTTEEPPDMANASPSQLVAVSELISAGVMLTKRLRKHYTIKKKRAHVIDFRDSCSTTMVRVPGSSGDSGFHRESTNQEETKVTEEPEIEASTKGESPSTPLNEAGFADRQSAGRSSDDVKKEEDSAMDLEEKPRLPPQTPSGVPADRDEHREPPDEGLSVKADGSSPTSNPSRARSSSKKSKMVRASKKKMKAPQCDAEDRDEPEM